MSTPTNYILPAASQCVSLSQVYQTLQNLQHLPAAECAPGGGWVKPTAPAGGADAGA